MNPTGPVINPRYTVQPEAQPDLPPRSKKPDEIKYEKIGVGPNRGFYRRSPVKDINRPETVYTKAFFPQRIEGPYDYYLDWFEGYYYIPRDPQISVRKLVFGLKNHKMPTSGNIELFNKKFNNIRVPRNFCPPIDPCVYDWCDSCVQQAKNKMVLRRTRLPSLPGLFSVFLLVFLFVFSVFAVALYKYF